MTEADWKDPNGNLRGIELNQYDAVNWRTSRYWVNYLPTITSGMEYYVYDPAGGSDNPGAPGSDDVALVLDSGGGVSERYLWGPNPDQLLAGDVARNGSRVTEWYSGDHEGSIRQVVDNASNRVVQVMDYDAFGNLITAGDYGNPTPTLGVTAYNTGQSETGGQDNHWTVSGNGHSGSASDAGAGDGFSWADSSAASASWISIRSGGGSDSNVGPGKTHPTMTYTYTTTITVAAGSGITSIGGMLAADNELDDVSVNEVSSGVKFLAANNSDTSPFSAWHNFVLRGLHVGANTITFTVKDFGTDTGLAVIWGQSTVSAATIANDPEVLPRFLYTGQMNDPETGLMYYGARFYDPKTGRFINQDPAAQGENLYTYVNNDPMDKTDPSGMSASILGLSASDNFDLSQIGNVQTSVGGNVGTSSPSGLSLSGTYLAGSGAGMFSAGGGATRSEAATYSPIDPVQNTHVMQALNYAVQVNSGFDPSTGSVGMSLLQGGANVVQAAQNAIIGLGNLVIDAANPTTPVRQFEQAVAQAYNNFGAQAPSWATGLSTWGAVSNPSPDWSKDLFAGEYGGHSASVTTAEVGLNLASLKLPFLGAASKAAEAQSGLKIVNPNFTPTSNGFANVFQGIVNQVVRGAAANAGEIELLPSETAKLSAGLSQKTVFGDVVERLVADEVARTPIHSQWLKWTKNVAELEGVSTPGDFIGVGPADGQLFEVTTAGQVAKHAARWGNGLYGQLVHIAQYVWPF